MRFREVIISIFVLLFTGCYLKEKYPERYTANDWEGGVVADGTFEPKYEVRLQNDQDDEQLYLSPNLPEAQAYLREYGMAHRDLFIYEIETNELIEVSTP